MCFFRLRSPKPQNPKTLLVFGTLPSSPPPQPLAPHSYRTFAVCLPKNKQKQIQENRNPMNTAKKALTAVTYLTSLYPRRLDSFHHHHYHHHRLFYRLFSAQPQRRQEDSDDSHPNNSAISDFDSAQFSIPDTLRTPQQPTWDVHHRQRVERIFSDGDLRHSKFKEEEEEEESRRRILAKALLEAALEGPDEDADQDQEVKEEDQKSLSVGIIGAPNAGKSALTNFMVCSLAHSISFFLAIGAFIHITTN